MHAESLVERAVEDRVTRLIDEVGHNDGIFCGTRLGRLAGGHRNGGRDRGASGCGCRVIAEVEEQRRGRYQQQDAHDDHRRAPPSDGRLRRSHRSCRR